MAGSCFTSTATDRNRFLNPSVGCCRALDTNLILEERGMSQNIGLEPEPKTYELPILPLRNTVVFPSGISPLTVGRPLSLKAAEAALSTEEKLLGVVAQHEDHETE